MKELEVLKKEPKKIRLLVYNFNVQKIFLKN